MTGIQDRLTEWNIMQGSNPLSPPCQASSDSLTTIFYITVPFQAPDSTSMVPTCCGHQTIFLRLENVLPPLDLSKQFAPGVYWHSEMYSALYMCIHNVLHSRCPSVTNFRENETLVNTVYNSFLFFSNHELGSYSEILSILSATLLVFKT